MEFLAMEFLVEETVLLEAINSLSDTSKIKPISLEGFL